MKLLIAVGDRQFFEAVSRYLKREGHLCEEARDMREAGRKIANFEYDCILVALRMAQGSGLKLISRLKEQQVQAGIIALEDEPLSEERVLALNEGADDVVPRSIDLPELYARIRAVMRRKMGQLVAVMDFGKLKIRLDERAVEADGVVLQLTRKEFDILVFLARNRNRVVTKDSIAELLWGDSLEEPDSYDFIYAHVKNLRRKLSENGCGEFLQTVYGVGYKFSPQQG